MPSGLVTGNIRPARLRPREHGLHLQASSGYLHMGQAVPLVVPGYLEYLCPEGLRILRDRSISYDTSQQFLHALKL